MIFLLVSLLRHRAQAQAQAAGHRRHRHYHHHHRHPRRARERKYGGGRKVHIQTKVERSGREGWGLAWRERRGGKKTNESSRASTLFNRAACMALNFHLFHAMTGLWCFCLALIFPWLLAAVCYSCRPAIVAPHAHLDGARFLSSWTAMLISHTTRGRGERSKNWRRLQSISCDAPLLKDTERIQSFCRRSAFNLKSSFPPPPLHRLL